MNATTLYITTCRYVIQSNPYDPDSWAELYRYLPYVRQALSCCVCGQVLDQPMGSTNGVCQHQVCRDCLGGKMKYVRPQCSWCKDYNGFEENAQLRIVIQCFKKLCEYLSSSAIALNLSTTNNGGTNGNTLIAIIHEGMTIRDCYTPIQGTSLGLFPPKLQKINANLQGNRAERVDSREAMHQGEGRTGIGSLPMGRGVGGKRRGGSGRPSATLKHSHRRPSQHSQGSSCLSEPPTPDLKNSSLNNSTHDLKLCETVAAEHDYMNKSLPQDLVSLDPPKTPPLKVAAAKVNSPKAVNASPKSPKGGQKSPRGKRSEQIDSENHSSRKRKVSHTQKGENAPSIEKKKGDSTHVNNVASNSSSKTPAAESTNGAKQKASRSQKKGKGCRCGLATPNPGKLTCCGQRCPCYSAFKGCEDCRCRGCRNPRGDPARIPIYLKQQQQLQQQQQQVQQIQHQFIQIQGHSHGESADESDVEIDI